MSFCGRHTKEKGEREPTDRKQLPFVKCEMKERVCRPDCKSQCDLKWWLACEQRKWAKPASKSDNPLDFGFKMCRRRLRRLRFPNVSSGCRSEANEQETDERKRFGHKLSWNEARASVPNGRLNGNQFVFVESGRKEKKQTWRYEMNGKFQCTDLFRRFEAGW